MFASTKDKHKLYRPLTFSYGTGGGSVYIKSFYYVSGNTHRREDGFVFYRIFRIEIT